MSRARLPQEYADLRATIETFARDVIAPVAAAHYEAAEFPYEVVAALGDQGVFGLPFPEEVGGMGGDLLALCVVLEELARVDSSVAVTVEAAVCLGAMPLYRFGTPEQQQAWLPPLLRGERLAAFGLTEPGGGTDAGATRTAAQLDGDEWVINGSKSFITNSGTDITSLITVTAVTGQRADGRPEISAIVVPAGTPGLTVAPSYSKVGWAASDTHELGFADVRVPAANLLGERGRGYAQFLDVLAEGRIAIAAMSVGLAQGCVDECIAYSKQRLAFGVPIGSQQAIAFKIAEMELRSHTARLVCHDAAARQVAGEPFQHEAAIAKLHASGIAVDNARDAVQVFGGYGFMNDSAVARFWRDSKVLEIGEGTSEVQRLLIARGLGLPI